MFEFRDPRVDPRPRDRIRDRGWEWRVLRVNPGWVQLVLTGDRAREDGRDGETWWMRLGDYRLGFCDALCRRVREPQVPRCRQPLPPAMAELTAVSAVER